MVSGLLLWQLRQVNVLCRHAIQPFNNGGLMSSRCFVALHGVGTCAGYKNALGKVTFPSEAICL